MPKKRTILVPLDYWECDTPGHRHKTEEVAVRCNNKVRDKKLSLIKARETRRRNIKAARAWVGGARTSMVAESVGVSPTRLREILAKIFRVSRNRRLDLPPEPDEAFTRSGVKPQFRQHYLMRIQAVEDHWVRSGLLDPDD